MLETLALWILYLMIGLSIVGLAYTLMAGPKGRGPTDWGT